MNEHRLRLKKLKDRLAHQMIMIRVDEKNVEIAESSIEVLKMEIAECEQAIEERKHSGRQTKEEST